MTREEAITNLNMISVAFVEPVTNEQRKLIDDTFEMARQALSQEPCDDAISRDAVDKYIARLLSGYLYDGERERLEIFSAYLWELPSVTQKSGKWEDLRSCWLCSRCGYETHIEHNFCPKCGADMRGTE